jgi:hypothetical protein
VIFVRRDEQAAIKPRAQRKAPEAAAIEAVRALLQHYAARGAFRSFSERPGTSARSATFHFLWVRDVKFNVTYHSRTRTLTFVDMLPFVPARSEMDRHLRAFIRSRSDHTLPEHRRVDLRKVGVSVMNRHGAISVAFTLKATQIEYGTRKAVHLIHEVLMDFLNEPQYVAYNIEHFNLNPEMA